MMKAMFSRDMEVLTHSQGWILIDGCGKHGGMILTLDYLQEGMVPSPDSHQETEALLEEANYLVQSLVEECQVALQNKATCEPFCKVLVMTSPKEESKLTKTSNKPAVKLLYNRIMTNSYTPAILTKC